jgi:Skp family chaperone for outer membrane proteins
MNYKSVLLAALVAGLLPVAAIAQTAPAEPPPAVPETAAPAAPTAPTLPPPSAYPAKIALIMFEQAVYATNEGQQAAETVRKKFQPQKDKIDVLATDIDTLKKQLQAAPATLPEAERASRLKAIDAKDKQYQHAIDDAQTAYQAELQDALSKVAQKVDVVLKKYVAEKGYTILLNVGDQQSPVMWAAPDPNADITEAVVEAYNAASGVAAPPPPAPAAAPSAAHPKPATATPRTTPKPPTH